MRESYGSLYPRFWDGPTGQDLQELGKDAVIVALFLTSNRWANMIGFYELPVATILSSLPVLKGIRTLRRTLLQLSEPSVDFAYHDPVSSVVWVKEMARIRLGLDDGAVLSARDNRHKNVVRLYDTVRTNPFLGSFYDRYAIDLNLPRRRNTNDVTPQGPSQAPSRAQSEGLQRGIEASKQESGTGTGIRNQVQESGTGNREQESGIRSTAAAPQTPPTPEKPDDNVEVVTAMIRKEILPLGLREEDLVEATKARCATLRIPYNSSIVRKAVDSALVRAAKAPHR